jgi:hypothetical protein
MRRPICIQFLISTSLFFETSFSDGPDALVSETILQPFTKVRQGVFGAKS